MPGSQAPPGAAGGGMVGCFRGRPERRRRRHRVRHGWCHHGAGAGPPRCRRAGARARRTPAPRAGELVAARGLRRAAVQAGGDLVRRRGRPFAPGVHYVVGRQHQGLRRQPAPVPGARLRCGRAPRGHLARLAVRLCRPRALLRRGRADLPACTALPARTRPSPGAARRTRTRRSSTSRTSRTSRDRLRALGVHPSANAMGVDRRPGRRLHPVRAPATASPAALGAKSDAETCAIDPALADSAPAAGDRHPGTPDRHRRLRTAGRPPRRRRAPTGRPRSAGGRFVLAAGAVNSAALLLASADAGTPAGWRTPRARSGAAS